MSASQKDIAADLLPRNGQYGGSSFFGKNPIGLKALDPMPLPATFPNGAKAAVLMTYDVEGTYGNGQGDMAAEIANYFRMADKLESLGVKCTFNIVGSMAVEQGPDFVKRLHDAGSEVASHGHWHEMPGDTAHTYHGQRGYEENLESVRRSLDALERIIGQRPTGMRIPYGHFNEHTYDAMAAEGVQWTSNVNMENLSDPTQAYGPVPFRPELGGKRYDFIEIPVDSQTYDWSIWVADDNNAAFIERVNAFCTSSGIPFERTPKGALAIWRERIRQTVESGTVFTLLCHPINLVVKSDRWGDALEEFMFPVYEELAARQDAGDLWVPTSAEMTAFYHRCFE